jgi:hypothetical protein
MSLAFFALQTDHLTSNNRGSSALQQTGETCTTSAAQHHARQLHQPVGDGKDV